MRHWRNSILALSILMAVVGLMILPINRNTARQIWYSFDTRNAPKGGTLIIGGQRMDAPHDYGDTWFRRYYQFRAWMHPRPEPRTNGRKVVIMPEEEPMIWLGDNSPSASNQPESKMDN